MASNNIYDIINHKTTINDISTQPVKDGANENIITY